MEPLRDPGFPRIDPPVPAVERIRDLDLAQVRARGLRYDLAWEYGDAFVLPSQKTGLLAAGLTTEEEIDELTTEIDYGD